MLATFAPDCIVSDILRPDMNGLLLLRTLREQGSRTPDLILPDMMMPNR